MSKKVLTQDGIDIGEALYRIWKQRTRILLSSVAGCIFSIGFLIFTDQEYNLYYEISPPERSIIEAQIKQFDDLEVDFLNLHSDGIFENLLDNLSYEHIIQQMNEELHSSVGSGDLDDSVSKPIFNLEVRSEASSNSATIFVSGKSRDEMQRYIEDTLQWTSEFTLSQALDEINQYVYEVEQARSLRIRRLTESRDRAVNNFVTRTQRQILELQQQAQIARELGIQNPSVEPITYTNLVESGRSIPMVASGPPRYLSGYLSIESQISRLEDQIRDPENFTPGYLELTDEIDLLGNNTDLLEFLAFSQRLLQDIEKNNVYRLRSRYIRFEEKINFTEIFIKYFLMTSILIYILSIVIAKSQSKKIA